MTSFLGVEALYLFLLAGVAGYTLARRVPRILHTPFLAASNFMHSIVLVGATFALLTASSTAQQAIGFIGVAAATANALGGFLVGDRLLRVIADKANASKKKRRQRADELAAGDSTSDADATRGRGDDNTDEARRP